MTTVTSAFPHSRTEDGLALIIGTVLIAFGLLLVRQGGIVTGGTAGIALYLHYVLGYAFGITFFLLNLPFYYLAVRRMGWGFTLKTFAAIALVSIISDHTQGFITLSHIEPLYAALMGNVILGVGFIVLFRHRASLGGLNILMLFLQDRFGWRAGWLQMGADVLILCLSLTVVALPIWFMSIVGTLVLNLIIALNHRSGRYQA
ncbi:MULTISPECIES: YitT family protein [Pseudomonas]|uniref:YitT family protein n=1 Tax=Pseudomonas TaxID=286 RepID=UPI00235FC5AA|nr:MULTISPECIES: YitT family protein [Pseudomonas]WJV24456.1 YitT family protein [Pseudomonas chlororaphis]